MKVVNSLNELVLDINNRDLLFQHVNLEFRDYIESNVFALKNNKTLRETISHRKYQFLKNECEANFRDYLDVPLGEVLLELKQNNNQLYTSFLNPYGDKIYSQFSIQDSDILNQRGLYAYTLDYELVYIGRCLDTFKKRINYGYGKIAPKNCFRDGQSTNCHLNALITQERQTKPVHFYVYSLKNNDEIKLLEKDLIQKYNPRWNKQMKLKDK